MNIFQVLSQGKARLHEPSMSATLGYFLDSNKDHGLGDAFVRIFLEKIHNKLFESVLLQDSINSRILLEQPYQLNGARKDIDIEISLLDKNHEESHRIIIENKIRVDAANPTQLVDYYNAVLEDDPEIKNLIMVFLTPRSNNNLLTQQFENLNVKHDHHKKWLFWDSDEGDSIVSLIKSMLNMEAQGKINPINEYMRHTLKAFIRHSSAVVQSNGITSMRTGDIGEVIEEIIIKLQDGQSYQVVRRDSSQIQVFNSKTGDKEVARRVLARFIDENCLKNKNGIKIPHQSLNTRQIGQQFFDSYSNSKI